MLQMVQEWALSFEYLILTNKISSSVSDMYKTVSLATNQGKYVLQEGTIMDHQSIVLWFF